MEKSRVGFLMEDGKEGIQGTWLLPSCGTTVLKPCFCCCPVGLQPTSGRAGMRDHTGKILGAGPGAAHRPAPAPTSRGHPTPRKHLASHWLDSITWPTLSCKGPWEMWFGTPRRPRNQLGERLVTLCAYPLVALPMCTVFMFLCGKQHSRVFSLWLKPFYYVLKIFFLPA